jgi:hypothetical protein
MAGERCCIGHNYTITHQTIVRDVRLGHDEAVISDLCEHSAAGGAAMDRHKLANLVSLSDPGL